MLPNRQAREECQLTANGDQFLVFDSGIGDPENIFIFVSDLDLQCLYECDIGSQMILSRYALRYLSKFTLFIANNEE